MSKEYKQWLSEQTFETLAADNYNIKLLLLKEQANNKKLIDMLQKIVLDIIEYPEIPFNNPMTGKEIQEMDKHNLILKLIAIQEQAQKVINEVNYDF